MTMWTPRTTWLDDKLAELNNQTPIEQPTTFKAKSAYQLPKQWAEQGMNAVGGVVAKVPGVKQVLNPLGRVFNWVHEKIEIPFGTLFSPNIPWKQGETFFEHAKREYEAWDAPTYVKGAIEFANPIWWVPWLGWAAKGAKTLGVGAKAASTLAKMGSKTILPTSELLDNTLFRAGRLTMAMGHVPVVNKIVKMVGGEGVFISRTEAQRVSKLAKTGLELSKVDALTKARMELVKAGFINDMRNGVKRLLVPRLQVIEANHGGLSKILGMDSKGVVTNIVDKSGKSQYLYDVLEGAVQNKENYKFLTKESEQYVDELAKVLGDVFTLAKTEGVKVPKVTILHRIVKGKTGKAGYEATETGSSIEMLRTHKTMKGGVEAGVDYGLDINESVSSTIDHYIREVSKKRFTKEVGQLGHTAKQMWDSSPEGIELALLHNDPQAILKQPERLNELITQRGEFLKHFQGQQILGEGLAKFHMHPSFKNKIFPAEVVKTTEKILNDEGQKWITGLGQVSGTSRMLTAAMDLSAPFIQGAAVFGRNPIVWARGVKKMLQFGTDPNSFYRYLTDPKVMKSATERIAAGGASGTFEYFNALAPLQRIMSKIPVVGKGAGRLIGQSYGRAEVAFSGFGEVSRNLLWDALKGTGKSAEELMDVARTIDRMTGVMSTEALAIGRTQQDFENAFVFFAPRYTRAGLTLAGDMLKGGIAGSEARKAIGGLLGGGLAMYYGVCQALGQEPNFDISSSKFMTVKIGDSHIGVGGIMTALTRLGYDVATTAIEDPVNLIKPLSEGKLNRWDNPFIKFMYSRTAPLTSTIYSVAIENTNYYGEPFENVQDWARFMLDKVTPIASQEITDWATGKGKFPQATTIVSQFAGLRRFPKSAWELLDENRDKESLNKFNQPYDNLNDLQKIQVNKSDVIRTLQKDVDAQTVTRGDATSVSFLNRQREQESARAVYEETLWNLQRAYDDGAITGKDFKDQMSDAGYGLGATYEHIDSLPEYADVMKVFDKPRNVKDKTIGDIAYNEFMDKLFRQNEFNDQYGLFDYDAYNEFVNQFRQKYGEEVWQYIQERKAEKDSTLPPLAQEYQKAKEILRPYWEVENEIIKRRGERFAASKYGQSLIQRNRQLLKIHNPEIAKYVKMFYSQA